MKIEIVETWQAQQQATEAMQFTDQNGKEVNIPAKPERTLLCGIVKVDDGVNMYTHPVEFPSYGGGNITKGQIWDVDSPALQRTLGRPSRIKNMNRLLKEAK
jgi:hypothetical protein